MFEVPSHLSQKMLLFPFSTESESPYPLQFLSFIDLSLKMLELKGLVRSARIDLQTKVMLQSSTDTQVTHEAP